MVRNTLRDYAAGLFEKCKIPQPSDDTRPFAKWAIDNLHTLLTKNLDYEECDFVAKANPVLMAC